MHQDMRLTQHFPLSDFTKSATADRLGIDNTLHPVHDLTIINNLRGLCTYVMEPIRTHFGKPITPTSGYRSLALEKVLCAKAIKKFLARDKKATVQEYLDRKQHPKGYACDFEIAGVRNIDLAYWIEATLTFDQLILEFYKEDDPTAGWVHVSYRSEATNRQEVLTLGDKGAVRGLPPR